MGEFVQGALPRCPRYISLDLWRGIACLFVVIFHSMNLHAKVSSPSASGAWAVAATQLLWIGVPLFFVISGYCITAAADSSLYRVHSIRNYFLRRFRRIYPPYWVLLGCAVVFITTVEIASPGFFFDSPMPIHRPWWFSPSQWLGNITLTETWRYHVGGSSKGCFLGMIWTLCYEEQFYAVTGLLLLLGRRYFFHGAAVVTGGTLVLGFLSRYYGFSIEGFFFDGFWLLFAAGILVYYRVNYAAPKQIWAINTLLAITALAASFGLPFIHGDGERLQYYVPVGFTFALLISLIHRWDRSLASTRWLRPLFYCGTLCYSMYLVHMPLVRAISEFMHQHGVDSHWSALSLTVPVCVAVSLVSAWIFHILIERRFLNPPQTVKYALAKHERHPAAAASSAVAIS